MIILTSHLKSSTHAEAYKPNITIIIFYSYSNALMVTAASSGGDDNNTFCIPFKRLAKECAAESCGLDIFMAEMFNRFYCGMCIYFIKNIAFFLDSILTKTTFFKHTLWKCRCNCPLHMLFRISTELLAKSNRAIPRKDKMLTEKCYRIIFYFLTKLS
ncbi:ribosomal protein S27A [Aphis craccivora]|uniref:Ribosomal protein S27A n=1 Tax=Aphis craccivora TaxID=307492 RepID=A0A6G0Z1B0_APHCR|nr:ribosomal protein S27A [Aphis craccivora]